MVAPDVPDVEVEQVTAWLYCIASPIVNAYAIRQSADVILVDSGVVGYERAYLRALAQITGEAQTSIRVREIFLTHGHDDHTGSAAALARITGAAVRGPARDRDVIEGRVGREEPQLLDWEVPLFERYGVVPPAPAVKLDATAEDGDSLDWERSPQVIAAPGHTAGSVCLFFPGDGVLIAGDAIMSLDGEPHLGVFNVDPKKAKSSLRRLAQLAPTIACVGHGPALTLDTGSRLARLAEDI